MDNTKDSKHKYSTWVLFILGGIIILTSIASAGLDGYGTKNYLAKFSHGEVIVNSQIYDDGENITINGSRICTFNSGCGGVTPSGSNNTLLYTHQCYGVCDTLILEGNLV